jgi:hypothetical protein
MDLQISAQLRETIASVWALAQSRFKANTMRWMDGTFPWENMKKLAGLDPQGMPVADEYGEPHAGTACRCGNGGSCRRCICRLWIAMCGSLGPVFGRAGRPCR